MLIRNLDVTHGLCNGTRMQVMKMTKEALYCRILAGPRADAKTTFIIPKAMFEYGRGKTHRGLRFCRRQFPVRLCFAMTVNKVNKLNNTEANMINPLQSQGQTLIKMGLVLNGKQCFSHGQAYVAMSRVTSLDGIRIFSPSTCRGHENYIENVVYQELLDNRIIPMPQHTVVEENLEEDEEFLEPEDPLPDSFEDFCDFFD
jgi:ATP-dependent DNA helicase PIF1